MYKHILLLFVFIIVSCSSDTDTEINIPLTADVEDLVNHSDEFNQEVLTYETPGGRIHFAIGFGIANSIMIEGQNANIIIDTADSTYEAEKIYALFSQLNSNPIEAIIYTHNHGDHTFGAAHYLGTQEKKPIIIAHQDTDFYVQRIMGILNPIITTRSAKMFGTMLPDEDLINVGIGPNLSVSKSPTGYIKPNVTFEDKLITNIAGIDLELYHAPGETNDQIFIWLPKHKALMPGDNIYKTFPNLYTIRGTSHRDVKGWINSLDHMSSFDAEFLFPSHTRPVEGKNEIQEIIILYRDAIQYIHDQTIRLMNQGLYPDQIIEEIELPKELADSPYLFEFYGTLRWSVKSIYNGYLGWFNGNPSELDPLSRLEKAKRISGLAGGNEKLFEELKVAVRDTDMQWALELSDYLLALDHNVKDVKNLRAKALVYEGLRSSNPNKRNYFLSSAMELNGLSIETTLTDRTSEDLLEQISIDTMFEVLSVRYNPKTYSDIYVVCFQFDTEKVKNIILRNKVAVINSEQALECNLQVALSEINFKEILVGRSNPVALIASGQIVIYKGSSSDFLKFLTSFR